jgi:hypothetical protein
MSTSKTIRDLQTIRRLVNQASATEAPAERHKALQTATRYIDRVIVRIESAPSLLGQMGGKETAKRGSEYFREIAAMRKTHAGGRPRKQQA